jgi:hypothetical protein
MTITRERYRQLVAKNHRLWKRIHELETLLDGDNPKRISTGEIMSLARFSDEQLESELKKRKSKRENEQVSLKRKDVEAALQVAAGISMHDVQKIGGQDMVNWLLQDLGYGFY